MNSASQPSPVEVTCAEVKRKLDAGDEFLFLDCREPDEYELVRLPGTKLLPMSQIQDRVGELDEYRESEIIVHCHHGGRSLQVVHWLRRQGFLQTASLSGGIDAWAVDIDPQLVRY